MSPTERAATAIAWQGTRRLVFAILTLGSSTLGSLMMWQLIQQVGLTPLKVGAWLLFTLTFSWLTVAFWSSVIGFVLMLARRDPITLLPTSCRGEADSTRLSSRTALIMPIYNEPPEQTLAGLEASCLSLLEEANGPVDAHIEAFVLSDTQDPKIAAREQALVAGLQQRLAGKLRVHYRRRDENKGKKAGNLMDFCECWGRRYSYFVVLDADSLMGGRTLLGMIGAMQRQPDVGLIQSVPIPIGQRSMFGRMVQFAATLYSPMLAVGQSFWQGDAANFWGHNAIIRTHAFMAHCGMPTLSGPAPWGGYLLSHDFVEAALLRRGGWKVLLDTHWGESFEGLPGNLLDYANRDRRWLQGNLQHLRLLGGSGLHPLNRLHFLLGAFSYMASLLWLLIVAFYQVDIIFATPGSATVRDVPPHAWTLLGITLSLLLMPKLLGVSLALIQRPQAFGGRVRLAVNALLESAFAVLIAPLMMVLHSFFLLAMLSGRSITWLPQQRTDRTVTWREAWRHTRWISLAGMLWAVALYLLTLNTAVWLLPVWLGLSLATLVVQLSSRSLSWPLLGVPVEYAEANVLGHFSACLDRGMPVAERLLEPPPHQAKEMPVQSFRRFSSRDNLPLRATPRNSLDD
ncbi:glucans biosynthesis glucosyltransferase MdoH [Vreelandella rituensis]|uniref:Glucans biosynthesis glucosyltransferase H n=1 Tax=Vreelandella rituensis TaxID=2282306 RepID=A0A368U6Z4_9GAMM|nr:glucans biosynthesis glucosyltransferase MdoH [Halomonas rituensis]RCV92939.1 glucans biosynthesis glucosyltransferase MdoH [Halomonas rituensis]